MEKVAMSRRLPSRSSLRQLRRQAKDLLAAYRAGRPEVLSRFRVALPRMAGATDAAILAAGFTLQDAQHVLAVEYGFDAWAALRRHVEGAGGDSLQAALDAIAAGDLQRLSLLLSGEPDLASRRRADGNTLLHVASWSKNVDIVRVLLRNGADVNARAGEGWMPLHNAAEGDHVQNLAALLEGGADVLAEACGDGGTALAHALFSGARRTAEVLAARAVVPANLRVAAGIGDVERLRALFDASGALTAEAGQHRGFYRHHAEYPAWTPSDDPQEILDEALVYACLNGRSAAVDFLLDRGANVSGMPYFMTGLHAAVQGNAPAVVQTLLARGADLGVRDRNYGGTPYGWSRALERHEIRDLLAPHVPVAASHEPGPDASLFDLIDAGLEERVAAQLALGADPNATRTRQVQISGMGMSDVTETALQAAAAAGHRGIGERLAAAGARIDLHAAAFLDRIDQLGGLLGDAHPDDRRDAFGRTALHRAIQGGAEAAIRWLIERGASVKTHADTYTFGARALHVAAAVGASARVIDLLIAAGAGVNDASNPGTPLRLALQHGRRETADLLRARGATE
jgi:ankyrin repeat protein